MAGNLLGYLVWKVTGDTSGFDSSIVQSEKKLKSFEDRSKSIGTNLSKYVTLPILAVGAVAIKTAASFERQEVAFQKLLRSTEKGTKLFKDLKEFSAKTPLQLGDITTAAERLLAFGTASEDVIDQIRRLGDLARGNSESLDRLTNAYGKLQAKGKATLEELNLFTEAGVPIIKELAAQYGVTTQELFKLIETGKVGFNDVDRVLTSLTSTGGLFEGQMAAAAETTEGKFSTALDNVKLAAAELGAILLPIVKDILDVVTEVSQGFAGLDDDTKKLIVQVGLFAGIIGPAILAVGKLTSIVRAFNLTALSGPTGIIALVGLAAGAITILISKIRDSAKETEEATRKYQESFAGLRTALFDQVKLIDQTVSLLRELGDGKRSLSKLDDESRESLVKNLESLKVYYRLEGSRINTTQILNVLLTRRKKLMEENDKLEKDFNSTTKEGNNIEGEGNKLQVKTNELLGEYEKKLIEINIQRAENTDNYRESTRLKLQLIEDEEKSVIKSLEKQVFEGQISEDELLNAKRFYAAQKLLVTEESLEQEEELIRESAERKKEIEKETTQFFINQALAIAEATIGYINASTEARLEAIEREQQAALEAAGVAEETELQKAQTKLQIAEESGDAIAIAEAETNVERAAINEAYERKKTQAAYEGALSAWKLELALAIAQAAIAVVNAYSSAAAIPYVGWVIAPFAATAAGIAGGIQVAAVAKSKPEKPQYEQGVSSVPYNMEAYLHEDEMVVPKPFADSVRDDEISIGSSNSKPITIQLITQTGQKLKEWIFDGTKDGTIKIDADSLVKI